MVKTQKNHLRRILVVFNPRSSKYQRVSEEVLEPLRHLKGYLIGKYKVAPTDTDSNAKKLAKLIQDDDLVIAAGGDGTTSIAINAIMLSKTNATLGTLPYGNFNDVVKNFHTYTLQEILDGQTKPIWPLEAIIDGRHFRFSIPYFTLGLFAESCVVFDDQKTRQALRKGNKTSVFSWITLAKWYFKNRFTHTFLPPFKLNGQLIDPRTTDVVAVNGVQMAGVMRGYGLVSDRQRFLVEAAQLSSFLRLCVLMGKSIFHRIPGYITDRCVLDFINPASFEIQAEGEYKRFHKVKNVTIKKADHPLNVRVSR